MRALRLPGMFAAIFVALGCAAADVGDVVAPPPIVQGFVAALAVDGDGNRYVTGSFYDSQDFNPGTGADVKSAVGWSDLFVTRFNADGSYAWTTTLGVANGSTAGTGVTVANGVVYAAGTQFISDDAAKTTKSSAVVAAFDATSGALKTDFGAKGLAAYAGTSGAAGVSVAVSGKIVYATGSLFPDVSQIKVDGVEAIATLLTNSLPRALTFVWALDGASGASLAGFGSGGVAALSGIDGSHSGRAMLLSDGALYVSGTRVNISLGNLVDLAGIIPHGGRDHGGTPDFSGAAGDLANLLPRAVALNAFIASLDPNTGALNAAFSGGVKYFGGSDSATGNGLAAANGVVYLTGAYIKAPADGAAGLPNSDAYVLAVDAKSGVEVAGFGTAGVRFFGRQFNDEGVALAVDAGTLYVTGGYGNLTTVGGVLYTDAMGGAGGAAAAPPDKHGPPKPLSAGSTPTAKHHDELSPGAPAMPDPQGILNKIAGPDAAAGLGALSPIWAGGLGVTDAFVLALDAATGAAKTNFSTDGLQTFGGSTADGGLGIAVVNGTISVAGYSFSTDAGVGGLGAIDATGRYSFLLTLDTATGGGGAAEANTAPVVHAGGAQKAKIPEHPDKNEDRPDFQAWLWPTVIDDGLPNPPGALTLKWEKVSGPGDVTFGKDTEAFTSVKFSAAGTYELRLTASDSVLSGSDVTTFTVAPNISPVVDSAPVAQPNTAATGQAISFTAAAHDPDGDELYYWWDFGDDCYGYGAADKHAYLAPGTYTATVHTWDGTDETTAEVKVTITGDPIFHIDDMQFSVDFAGKKRGGMRISGTAGGLPQNFSPAGTTVQLDASGAQCAFKLDSKGRSKNAQGTFSLKRSRAAWKFSAKLNSSAVDNGALGLSNTAVEKAQASMPVGLSIGGTSFSGSKTVRYSIAKDMAKGK